MTGLALRRARGSLDDLFSGRDNAVGFIRLALALAVVLSHSRPLGFGQHDVGYLLFGRQTNIGTMAVYGFFVLSGLLITRSARRVSLGRYLWHRVVRIMPGLWACLIVTVLVIAPVVALHERGTTAGLWAQPFAPGGPLAYLTANWWTGVRQYGIEDLLADSTPWGRIVHASVFDGPLWSLVYEMLCYLAIGAFAVTAVLKRARLLVLVLTMACYGWIVASFVSAGRLSGPVQQSSISFDLPLVGLVSLHWIMYLGFLFLLGATFDLYRDRIPVHDGLGVLSGLLLVASLLVGGFFVVGLPAFAYLLVWLAVRLPKRLHAVGRRNDYSYGIYIYGFIGQQVLASFGANRWGFVPFVAQSMLVAVLAAVASWHLVERRALLLKNWSPSLRLPVLSRRRSVTAAVSAGPPAPSTAEVRPVKAHRGDWDVTNRSTSMDLPANSELDSAPAAEGGLTQHR